MAIIKNSLEQSHEYVEKFVKLGDVVIDATCGNGNDTVFLAELVGENGKVYAFDIQQCALTNTSNRMLKKGLKDRVVLINDGHENIEKYVGENVKAVMFNLGYLPKGDHSIGTKAQTTIKAIEASLSMLQKGGVISIVIYYGKDSGCEEKEEVMKYLCTLEQKKYIVMITHFINQHNCPPILACVEKL